MGVVEETADIVQERERTNGIVTEAVLVIGERVSSNSRIRSTSRVEQQCCSTNRGIRIGVVEGQRGGANGSVGAGVSILKERERTDACVSQPTSERLQRVASFRCSEVRIATVRRWSNRVHLWQHLKTGYRRQDCCEYDCTTFHGLSLPFIVFGFFVISFGSQQPGTC